MPTFRFTPAGTFAGQYAARRIVAASREEAAALLAAEGIDVAAGELVDESTAEPDSFAAAERLSAEQSMRLAEGVAGLDVAVLEEEQRADDARHDGGGHQRHGLRPWRAHAHDDRGVFVLADGEQRGGNQRRQGERGFHRGLQ